MATLQALKTGVWRKSEFKRQMANGKTRIQDAIQVFTRPADRTIKHESPPATRNVPLHCDAKTLAESVQKVREYWALSIIATCRQGARPGEQESRRQSAVGSV